jgi:hypothetical protein
MCGSVWVWLKFIFVCGVWRLCGGLFAWLGGL